MLLYELLTFLQINALAFISVLTAWQTLLVNADTHIQLISVEVFFVLKYAAFGSF